MRRYNHKALYNFMKMKGWANWYEPVIKYPTQNWEPKKHTLSLNSKKIRKSKKDHDCYPSKENCYACKKRK